MPKAKFQCLRCDYKWEDKPGPTVCPICRHDYVKWLNYYDHWQDLDIKQGNKKDA